MYTHIQVADRWLNVRLELLGNTVVLLSALLSVRAATQGRLVAGLAGLAITNALSVTGLLNWAVRCYAETETMMNSVEVRNCQMCNRHMHDCYNRVLEACGCALRR
jgi:hypothetical protein